MVRAAKLIFDMALATFAFWATYDLIVAPNFNWWFSFERSQLALSLAITYGAIAGLCTLALRVERLPWRFVSLPDIIEYLRIATVTAAVYLAFVFVLNRATEFPRSTFALAWFFHLTALAGSRFLARAIYERRLSGLITSPWSEDAEQDGMLIIGSPDQADSYLRDRERGLRAPLAASAVPVGVLTDRKAQKRDRLRTVPIVGRASELAQFVEAQTSNGRKISAILFLDDVREIAGLHLPDVARLRSEGVKMLRAPRITEMSEQDEIAVQPREIGIEDLLSRPPVDPDPIALLSLTRGKRVMITGAGGSIGSELSRQIAALGCAHLTLFEMNEFNLYTIDKEIGGAHPSLSKQSVLGDVRDREFLDRWVGREKPDLIFHAAALKHVPVVEAQPCQGALTNIVGTRNVTVAAHRHGVETLVMISTDKAVKPSSIMGATKRVAEMVVRSIGHERDGANKLNPVVVRFGNVLGSAGSVVPLFRQQIKSGGPITVTHPDVERYFMTIAEAVQLVLHAAALSVRRPHTSNGVFVLEMGRPVKIVDLATQMAELYGYQLGRDIGIEFVGLRPGEKLREELVDEGETAAATECPGIQEVTGGTSDARIAGNVVDELESLAQRGDAVRVVKRLNALLDDARALFLHK
ncbi:MAG: nucleoside-diphosphate sugar epimerase/dehydratase [Pseudomonadota bacterium]